MGANLSFGPTNCLASCAVERQKSKLQRVTCRQCCHKIVLGSSLFYFTHVPRSQHTPRSTNHIQEIHTKNVHTTLMLFTSKSLLFLLFYDIHTSPGSNNISLPPYQLLNILKSIPPPPLSPPSPSDTDAVIIFCQSQFPSAFVIPPPHTFTSYQSQCQDAK